jgi:hypothetical protein
MPRVGNFTGEKPRVSECPIGSMLKMESSTSLTMTYPRSRSIQQGYMLTKETRKIDQKHKHRNGAGLSRWQRGAR